MSNEIAIKKNLADTIAEYDYKLLQADDAVKSFEDAGKTLKEAACLRGVFGDEHLNIGSVYVDTVKKSLLKSAWKSIYKGYDFDRVFSAEDKRRFEQSMASPAPFTMDNIRATFGDFILDPRGNILRGLAEVFCSLDPAYKSHDKVKIGVKGLPKRVILSNVGAYSSWGRDRLENMLNALAQYQGKPLVEYYELERVLKSGSLVDEWEATDHLNQPKTYPARGVWLKRFSNGNGHLFFTPDTLRDINMALAEFYGDVLPDTTGEKPTEKQASTAVAKDLQYYPTPAKVVKRVVGDLPPVSGEKILEPSCGCGRLMDALRSKGAQVVGVEIDPLRAGQCRAKGHSVIVANFLETVPTGDYDRVVMNPPFYGKHYAKHVEHAFKFLKVGGILTAILPATARYDHGLLTGEWHDLPVGSFSESGTNVNTTVLTIRKKV